MKFITSSKDNSSAVSRDGTLSFYGFVLIVTLLFLSACAPSPGAQGDRGATAKAGDYADLDAEEKVIVSDSLTDEAEEKLGYQSMNEAWGKFSEALTLNPENQRAIFWKEMLKPVLELKGLVARVRPLYLSQPNGQQRYDALVANLRRSGGGDYFRYMTQGPSDIKTDADMRAWMDRIIVSLDTLRTFLKANKDREYVLRAPVTFLTGMRKIEKNGSRCAALHMITSKFTGCPENGMVTVKMNRADIEVLQSMLAIPMMNLAVVYAYNFNPTVALLDFGRLSTREVIKLLVRGYDGGILERNRLSLGKDVVPDWIAAERYLIQNQEDVCKYGPDVDVNRPGYLVPMGLCMTDAPGSDGLKVLDILETILQGRPIKMKPPFSKNDLAIYPFKIFDGTVSSMLPHIPKAFDANGNASEFSETAYSVFFAEGKISDILTAERALSDFRALPWEKQKAIRESEPDIDKLRWSAK